MQHFDISTPLHSHHMHNEHTSLPKIIRDLKQGRSVALISDANPAISDPGFLLVREAIKKIEIECLQATAFVPALVLSGLPNDRFIFEAFFPLKRKTNPARKDRARRANHILYESPHKLLKTLGQLASYCGEDRQISVSRELTKLHEETFRGSLKEAISHFEQKPPKGEFVLCLSGKSKK